MHLHKSCAARLDISTIKELLRGTAPAAAPHTRYKLPVQIVRLDIPYEHATRAGCKRSHTELLRCVPGNSPTGNRITGMHAAGQVAGCGAQLRSTALLPSQFRQSLPAARVVTHKTEASIRVSPQSVGMEHLDAAVSPSHPSPRKSTPARMQPSRAVSYTADTRHRALDGALLLSEGSSLSPGKRLHHQRSSRHAMVSLSDTSPHPGGFL